MKKLPLISIAFVALAGCGPNTAGDQGTAAVEASVPVETAEQVPDAPPAPAEIDDGTSYIECTYSDGSVTNYKITDSSFSAYVETDNAYAENVIYSLGASGSGTRLFWKGPGQKSAGDLAIQTDPDKFVITITTFENGKENKANDISINRKTGIMTDEPFMAGWALGLRKTATCMPATDLTAQQNQF